MSAPAWLVGSLLAISFAAPGGSAASASAGPVPEPVGWLREYLQIDTSGSAAGDARAVDLLGQILRTEGIEAARWTSPAGRVSLSARLPAAGIDGGGDGDGRGALVLLHHLDVVPVDEGWTEPPFSGRLADGVIWGRGAIDAKSLGVAHLAAFLAALREGWVLDRDLVFVAASDEELGGREGVGWLLEAHPEAFADAAMVLNEGGANNAVGERLLWWGIEVTQKRPLWLRVSASGRGGHGASASGTSATHQLVRGLARLVERRPRYRITAAARAYIEALAAAGAGSGLARDLDRIIQPDGPTRRLPAGMEIYFRDSLQITEIDNGTGVNVVAAEASATVDMRLLPDSDADAILAEIRDLLGDELRVEVLLDAPEMPASPVSGPLYERLVATLEVRAPVVPTFIPGTTDSRYFRARGIPVYGFSPFALGPDEQRGIHAVDESIPVDDFLRGIETMRRVVRALIVAE